MDEFTVFTPKTADRLLELSRQLPPRNEGGPKYDAVADSSNQVIFRNDSGEVVPAYGCLKIAGAILDTGLNKYVIPIDKPDGSAGAFLFNGWSEVEIDGYGIAHSMIVRALVTAGQSPSFGDYYGPSNGWSVEAGGLPAIQIYGELESGLAYGRVHAGWPIIIKCSPTADVAVGNPATVNVLTGQPPSANGDQIQNVWLDYETDEPIASGKMARAIYEAGDGVWRFLSAECETDTEPGSKITSSNDTVLPGTSSTAAAHINQNGVHLNDGSGNFSNVTTAPPA